VATEAISNLVFWNVLTGCPKTLRSRTYATVRSSAARADATADRDRHPLPRQVRPQVPKCSTLGTEPVRHRHPHVGERQFGGVLRLQSELVELAALDETRHTVLDHQQRQPGPPVALG
jgi:hypothetical protein